MQWKYLQYRFDILYNHLTLPVFTIIEQVTCQNANVLFLFFFCKKTSTPSSVAFQMPHRTFIFLMLYPLFLLLAIMCFDMISRRILFTKMYKNTKNVCSQFFFFFLSFFSSMHDKDIFVWLFFLTVTSIPNFVAEASPFLLSYLFQPPCDMISQAVPVIEMMNRLEKPIKSFCYKKKYLVWDFSVEKSSTENHFKFLISYNTVQQGLMFIGNVLNHITVFLLR